MDILVVDDHEATRREVLSLLEGQEDLHVVGQAASGEEGVREASRLRPDLILMDVVMPGMNGIDASRMIRASDPTVIILALSNHTGRNLVKAVLRAGATGYVRKDQAYEELLPAIRAVAGGREYVGSRLSD